MEILNAVIYGVIQGIAEFLPISSSAHLVLASTVVKGEAMPLALNVGLHMGTLVAMILFFFTDWLNLAVKTFEGLFKKIPSFEYNRLLPALLIGSIPAGIIGGLWNHLIEEKFENARFVPYPLIIFGILLWYVDKQCRTTKKITDVTPWQGFVIGLFQALALFPGVSRSGATIIGARLFQIDRKDAAKFSFMLGTPAMCGAALLKWKDILEYFHEIDFIVGFGVSTIVGILTIKFFLNFLKNFGFAFFAIYRVMLALAILAILYL